MNFENLKSVPLKEEHELMSEDYIRSHLFLGIRRCTQKDDCIKRKLLNLELNVKLQIIISEEETVSIRLTPLMLKRIRIPEEEIWNLAIQNTRKNIVISPLSELFGEPESNDKFDIYVIRAKYDVSADGASVLSMPDVIESACGMYSSKHGSIRNSIYIIPSSREEILLVPYTSNLKSNELASLVKEVNATISEEIQLEPVVYIFDRHTGEISIAASA